MSTTTTSAQATARKAFPASSSGAGHVVGGGGGGGITAEMRDRQARGKDPYGEGGFESETFRLGSGSRRDTFPQDKEKELAAQVLADRELLMMFAISRNDSIASTHLYFTRKLYGLSDNTPAAKPSRPRRSDSRR